MSSSNGSIRITIRWTKTHANGLEAEISGLGKYDIWPMLSDPGRWAARRQEGNVMLGTAQGQDNAKLLAQADIERRMGMRDN